MSNDIEPVSRIAVTYVGRDMAYEGFARACSCDGLEYIVLASDSSALDALWRGLDVPKADRDTTCEVGLMLRPTFDALKAASETIDSLKAEIQHLKTQMLAVAEAISCNDRDAGVHWARCISISVKRTGMTLRVTEPLASQIGLTPAPEEFQRRRYRYDADDAYRRHKGFLAIGDCANSWCDGYATALADTYAASLERASDAKDDNKS